MLVKSEASRVIFLPEDGVHLAPGEEKEISEAAYNRAKRFLKVLSGEVTPELHTSKSRVEIIEVH